MAQRYSKTSSGAKGGGRLPRTTRNLLMLIDGTRAATNWIELIHGATAADVELLLANGLIEPAQTDADELLVPTRSLESAVASLSYDQLYDLMTSQAKERLGLIKGFKIVLEVEKCSSLPELQALAVRFVGMVREVQGASAATKMCQALGMAA